MSGIERIGTGGIQPPPPRDLFGRVDGDRSGGVSQQELQKLSNVLQEATGKSIDTGDEAFKKYDANGDGSLSGEELKAVLDNAGFGPNRDMQGVAPPPPPPNAAEAYTANLPEADLVASLISGLQDLLGSLQSSFDTASRLPQPAGPPRDIFGKADTDRNGSLSQSELSTLAKAVKEATGQTLDVSAESIKALDRNGDGELSPDEVDLRRTLSLKNAEPGTSGPAGNLTSALDQNWRQAQHDGTAGGAADLRPNLLQLVRQMDEVKLLLETLTTYYSAKSAGSDPQVSMRS